MNFVESIHTSWDLMKSSLRVIRDQPRLALFPVIGTLCTFAAVVFFVAPLVVLTVGSENVQTWLTSRSWGGAELAVLRESGRWVLYSGGAMIYLGMLCLAVFFRTAFYSQVLRALAGEDVSLAGGLRFAAGRLPSIFMWTLLAGTVGLIIRAVGERLGWVGRFVMTAVGTVWSVAAVFAIPVIVRRAENNPLVVLRDSAATLKKTWGESLAGFVGLRLAGAALAVGAVGTAGVIALVALVVQQAWFTVSMAAMWLIALLLAAFVITMATHVYRCALYVYASEGVVPGPFTAEMMNAGWKIKKH